MRKRRKKEGEESSNERWLVSYADFMTLLFAFFTVLFATSNQDEVKAEQFQQSVKQYLVKLGGFGGSGNAIDQGEKYNTALPNPIKTFPQDSKKVKKTREKVEHYLEDRLTKAELKSVIQDITSEANGVRISIKAENLFAKRSHRFKPSAVKVMDKIASAIKNTSQQILVEGHVGAGAKSVAGQWQLSAMRAATVTGYLVKVHKMKQRRFIALGYGSSRPVVKSQNDQFSNSRVDFYISDTDFGL